MFEAFKQRQRQKKLQRAYEVLRSKQEILMLYWGESYKPSEYVSESISAVKELK